jgi:hypothetical protein
MKLQGLSFDNAPALHIPLRFFNTAPWMGVIASCLLLMSADQSFNSQWSPTLLATTHLFTLGFMATTMLGALFQVLPVISGASIPGSSTVATIVHILLVAGTLLLACGFASQNYQLFRYALPILVLAFACFLIPLGSLLLRKLSGGDSIFCIRLAALSFLITIAIGILKAANYIWPLNNFDSNAITYLHMAWGLLGWVLLLIMGVSYQVIPMFHVTPNYSANLRKLFPSLVFTLLVLLSISTTSFQPVLIALLIGVVSSYALYTLGLLNQRKRKLTDFTVNFWRLAMINLIMAGIALATRYYSPQWLEPFQLVQSAQIVIGIIVIYGFVCSVIMGMQQKIIPFLIYMHLQKRCIQNFELLKTLPHMGAIIPLSHSKWQFRLHCSALILLIVAALYPFIGSLYSFIGALYPYIFIVAALAVGMDFFWLGLTVAKASRLYQKTSNRISLEGN